MQHVPTCTGVHAVLVSVRVYRRMVAHVARVRGNGVDRVDV